MNILGISCFYHDAAAVLLKDGLLAAAAEEERFTRIKHDPDFPMQAIQFCLSRGEISIDQVDYMVFPLFSKKSGIKSRIKDRLKVPSKKILFVGHHLSHAASAFFCSPYKESAVLTVDGAGEWATASCGRAEGFWNGAGGTNRIHSDSEMRFPHSLGLLYSVFTAFLGFEVNEGEYKVMGMAPFGVPLYMDKVYRMMRVSEDGSFNLDMSYFSFQYHNKKLYTSKFIDLFGEPRNPRSRFATDRTSLFDVPNLPARGEIGKNQYYADVAASIQKVTEEILLKMSHHAYKTTGLKKLCFAGGVALNSAANYRILRETPFEELYIQPAAGDSGGALGAALYAYHVLLGQPRKFTMTHAYWGQDHGPGAVHDFLSKNGIRHETLNDNEKLFDRVAESLTRGKVIGWYQGAFEWGPRALGNRSILADPRNANMKDIVNMKIKFREPFRPFAPSVLQENCERYFDLPDSTKHLPARFMLYVTPIKKSQQANLPAVTHADGTGRLQTVLKESNPRYHRLIEKFGQATGIPVILNTSFNLKGEPIVNTPENAFNTFSKSGMDLLVMENSIVSKDE